MLAVGAVVSLADSKCSKWSEEDINNELFDWFDSLPLELLFCDAIFLFCFVFISFIYFVSSNFVCLCVSHMKRVRRSSSSRKVPNTILNKNKKQKIEGKSERKCVNKRLHIIWTIFVVVFLLIWCVSETHKNYNEIPHEKCYIYLYIYI